MKTTQAEEHPLKCPVCKDYCYIDFAGTRFTEGGKAFGIKIPIYQCKKCGHFKSIIPKESFDRLKADVMPTLKEDEFISIKLESIFPVLNPRKKFKQFSHLGFKYDLRDYYLIPLLYREWNDGYLTPVFFDKDLLLYYNSHPDYSVKLFSFSSGNIYHKGKPMFQWGFGINRNEKIFKWLGDLDKDFDSPKMKPHLHRFQASNIKSDHDIVSTFYFSQNPYSSSDMFQDSDNERKLFTLKNRLDGKALADYGITLAKIDIQNLHDYYKHPILEERGQIFEAYLSLTKFLIENLQTTEIIKALNATGLKKADLEKNGSKLGSLKLFGLFIKHVLKRDDSDKMMTPLFVLYDLRLLHGHIAGKSFDERYCSCKSRLGVPNETTDLDFFKVVVSRLIDFYKDVVGKDADKY